MSLAAVIPIASLAAANASLEAQGCGPRNFSVPLYASTGPTHAALHAWDDPVFVPAIKALPGVVWQESSGIPTEMVAVLVAAQNVRWGAYAPDLPTSGNAVAGTLYRYNGDELWWCIQTFSRTTFSAPPATYPALIRRSRVPGSVAAWVQPIDQYDAYKLLNPFTGQPDRATHNGQTWRVSQADGAGNNVWAPGAFGWTVQT